MLTFKLLRTITHNSLKQTDIAYFKSVIGADNVLTANIDSYNEDWMKRFHGKSKCVLRPPTTQAISQILKHCNTQLLPIVVQSGKTSLVGGSVPVNDEIIISMGRLNQIHNFNSYSSIVTCDAGCILQDVEIYVNQKDYILPMDLGAKGSCQVGGNISTHAGGLRYIKYGPLRGNVIGLTTVLANGEVLDLSNTMRKDNAGYDLKQLFIGTEGTLGVITKCSILCYPKPKNKNLCFIATDQFRSVKELLLKAKALFKDNLSAIEFFDSMSEKITTKQFPQYHMPFQKKYPFYVMIELISPTENDGVEALTEFLSNASEQISDACIPKSLTQAQELWKIRESICDAFIKEGKTWVYDISVPLDNAYEIVEGTRSRLNGGVVCGYAHLGDNNVHLNVTINNGSAELEKKIETEVEPYIYAFTSKLNGSINAEHGIGVAKKKQLKIYKPGNNYALQKSLKKLMDPNNILNPNIYLI